MAEGESNATAMGSVDEPLQLIEFKRDDAEGEGKTTIHLVKETLDHIVKQSGDKKLCIICICGPSRQGKSFILGHMIRCLECLEKDDADWMDWTNKTKPLKGFKFRNGTKPETQGIWVWSRPFHVKTDEGKEVSVLLIDTQGTQDEYTTHKEMSAIVGLSLLTSSVMIFNFMTNLQEDILCALNEYIEYGQLALDKDIGGTPFQKLAFLIRDWNNPGEFGYGAKGGKKFLEEKLRVKEGQAAEAVDVRNTMKKCFKDLDCYLMPYIGDKAIYPDFTGSIGELSTAFAKNLEQFISDLISNENLVIKEILGEEVTAPELRTFMEKYVEVFNSDELPTAAQMWSASTEINLINLVAKAMKTYQDCIKKRQRGNNYLQDNNLQKFHQAGEKQALEFFKKAKKFGREETISEYGDRLEDQIEKEFVTIKKQNEDKRKTFITQTMNECQTAFRSELEDGLPREDDNDTEFYEEKEISKVADQAKASALEDFREKIAGEGDGEEDKIHSLVQTLEHTLESTITSHINKNKLHRANAEKFMTSMVDDLTSKYKYELNERLLENKFIEFDELRGIRDTLRTSAVDSFKQTKKPGKKDFHAEYSSKLEENLESAYSFLENKHKIELQQIQQDADNYIKERCEEYEANLRKIAKTVEMYEELEIKHQAESSQIMGTFQSSVNPFPEGIDHRDVLQKKFESGLQGIFETVKREVLESQKRVEESYQEAVKIALEYYSEQMKDTLNSYGDDFIKDDDLQTEHDHVYKEALEQYEDYEKAGVPDNALDFKSELMEQLDKRYETIQRESVQKRESAIEKTKNCVHECKNSYQKKMKEAIEDTRDNDEFSEYHELAQKTVFEQFNSTCPVKDSNFQRPYLDDLKEFLEETFEELKDILELKRTEEETATKALRLESRQMYNDEMEKHCKNNVFLRPSELENLHQQTVRSIMRNIESKNQLSSFQKSDLEKQMKGLFESYRSKNDMNLNSGAHGIAPAIGIDLGTTYCCVGVFHNGKVIIIPNLEQGGDLTTPSYVTYHADGSETVGKAAKENAYKEPEASIYDAKRIIGRKMNDEKLQSDMQFWPFTVKDDGGIPKVFVNGKLLHPEQVSGKILKYLKEMVEKYLKLDPGTIKKAVITVPAYFNDGQRQATIDAGKLADLEVLTILNEPTAAAIAYSMERFDANARKVLIFDLGGGTFDVAVIDMKPKNIEVLEVDGDTHLGGEDFDKNMMKYCALQFQADEGIDLFDGKDSSNKDTRDEARRRLRRLQTYCENAKKQLASARTTTVTVDALCEGLDLTVEVTREKFEELNKEEFKNAIEIVGRALDKAGVRKEQIDDVVLVGGSSRILKVQEMLRDFFGGKALNVSIHPDHAVAHGAAVKAAMMNGEQARGQIDFDQIQDVTPFPIGIEIVTKELSVIIPKSTKIPTKQKEVYFTTKDNQTNVRIAVFQGEDLSTAVNNSKLGEFMLDGIPPAPQGKEPIDVWMEINSMGVLLVEAVIQSTKGRNSIKVTANKQRLTKEEINKLLSEAA